MTAPTIPAFPDIPQRTDTPEDFATKADAFLAHLPTFRAAANSQAAYTNNLANAVDADATAAENAKNAVLQAALLTNYQGSWSAGSYDTGETVYYSGDGKIYISNSDGNTAEPPAGDWVALEYLLSSNNLSDLASASTARTNLGLVIGTDVQAYDADTAKLDTAQTWAANQNFADYLLQRPTLKDYAIEGSAIGNTGASQTFDLETANFFTATLDQASTFTFSNPPGSGDFGGFILALTNGGAFTITWPASVDWAGGNAPTLTSSGLDILVFVTYDAGTTWHGVVSSLDSK